MPRASYGDRHCISVIHSKTHVALDFTSRIIDFFAIREGEPQKGKYSLSVIALMDIVNDKHFAHIVQTTAAINLIKHNKARLVMVSIMCVCVPQGTQLHW